MRILFVTQIVPYPPHGGVLQRGYNLLRELGRHHDIHLLAFHHPDELPPGEALERGRRELLTHCRAVEIFPLWPKQSAVHKLAAIGLSLPYPRPFSVLAHRSSGLRRRIVELCSTTRPDVVHLDTIALAPYRRECGNIPSVLTHHNIESQLMHRRAEVEGTRAARAFLRLQAQRLEAYERGESGRFPANIMVSENDAAILRSMVPSVSTVVIPNGVDTEYFTARGGDDGQTLIWTGGMNMFANRDAVDWFLDAVWPLIKARTPRARFVAIGRNPSARLRAAAAADPSVLAPGFVDDVRPWVEKASIYVVPLRVGGGTRLKMVDAMAQGKAIVATTIGAEGIRGERDKDFMLADDAQEFADTVCTLLENPERRRALGAQARRNAEATYAWPRLAKELAECYTAVSAGARA